MSETKDESNSNKNNSNKVKFKKKRRKLTEQEEKWKKTAYIFTLSFLGLFIIQLLVYAIVWNINDWVFVLVIQIVLVMPGYLSNAGMLVVGGGPAIDGGRIAKDGRPLFGPGKTWRGFLLGPLIFGIGISLAIHSALYANWGKLEPFIRALYSTPGLYDLTARPPDEAVAFFKIYLLGAASDNMAHNFLILFLRVTLISYGTAIGDLAGSWLKRRLGRQRGEPIWFVDQLDFVVMVLLCAMPFVPINYDFLAIVIYTLIFTPSLTVISNTITYLLGHKSVPW
ncbi:MAG: CDP-archaeol synthase [Promethearchaeota archaeon]